MNFPNKSFSSIIWSPKAYAEAAVLAREVGVEMLTRLDWMSMKPQVIVDMGCGTAIESSQLQMKYPNARVFALDNDWAMLEYGRSHPTTPSSLAVSLPYAYVCAEAQSLPFPSHSIDLIFANLLLPWCAEMNVMLREWRRVLNKDGVLILSVLGPDTLQEGRELAGMPTLIDMHQVGDLLLQENFADPVLDVNYYTLLYRNPEKMITELYQSGMTTSSPDTFAKQTMAASKEGKWPITYEVIFAHAFAATGKESKVLGDGVVKIPVSQLRKQV